VKRHTCQTPGNDPRACDACAGAPFTHTGKVHVIDGFQIPEVEPTLPGVEPAHNPMPEVAELPFSLTPETAERRGKQVGFRFED
jgi:hypothetical protein